MRNFKIIILFFVIILSAKNYVFSQETQISKLPKVSISTYNKKIVDEPKISAEMTISFPSAIDNSKDSIHYSGNIGIEFRGRSSLLFDKKNFLIELKDSLQEDISENLFGFGKGEDWILNGMYIEKTMLRIPLSFYLYHLMGNYAPKYQYVRLYLNNEYQGLYLFLEKIKRSKSRLNISKLKPNDIAGDDLTGGYILQLNWYEKDRIAFFSKHNPIERLTNPLSFLYYYPKKDKVKPEQLKYIENYISLFEEALFSKNFKNTHKKRYDEYIDVNSFIDLMIMNELSKNPDGYKVSTFFYKDKDSKGGKLKAGPIWDFDLSFGNTKDCSCHDFEGWTYLQNQDNENCKGIIAMPQWWFRMINDKRFKKTLISRWESHRQQFINEDFINNWIDKTYNDLAFDIENNFQLWQSIEAEGLLKTPDNMPTSY
ncbi:MAG: CotH kinase family protein, partial [Chitinophagales bacterium]